MGYKQKLVGNHRIENESSGQTGLKVTVMTDSLGKIDIVLGNSMRIRTDEAGVHMLKCLLEDAFSQIVIDKAIQSHRERESQNEKVGLVKIVERISTQLV